MHFGLHLSEAVLIPNPISMLPTWAPLHRHSYGTQFPCPHPTLTHILTSSRFGLWLRALHICFESTPNQSARRMISSLIRM